MGKAGILVGIALVAGGGVGYLLGRNTSATSERTERRDQPVYAPPPAERDPEGPRPKLTEGLDDLPAPRFPAGSGIITGTVKTEDGKPLRGVVILATQRWRGSGRPYRRGEGAPRDESLEEIVRKTVEFYRRNRATRRDAVTVADGKYSLEGLLESEKYNVRAYLEGYQLQAQAGNRGYEVSPGTKVDFVAQPIARLLVDVVMPDGTRPARVNLVFRGKQRAESAQWTPEYPSVGVAPGTYTLATSLERESDYTAEPVEIEVFAKKPNPPVTIHMRSQPGIRATVKLPEGAKASYMHVYAVRMRAGEPPPRDRLRNGKQARRGRVGFAIKDLAPGRYLVGVLLGNDTVLDARTVEVTDHMVQCDFSIKEFNPADFVRVRVLGPDGRPVPGVKFSTAFRTQTASSSGGGYAITLKDRYLVAHHPGDDPGGTNYLTARSDKYGSKEVAYSKEKTRELEIRFAEPAKLKVVVTGYAGSEAENMLSVRLVPKGSHKSGAYRENKKVPPNGTLTLGPAEAGEYELRLYVGGASGGQLRAFATPVMLRAGDNEAVIAAPRLYSLTIAVPGGEGQVQIQPEPRGDFWFYAHRDLGKTGRVTFGSLPAGRYKISATGGEMIIDLRATRTITFQAQLINAMRVTISDPDGEYAAAGFANGDLIVGVDGVEFRNRNHMWGLLTLARGKERATLTILRGGRRIELTVDLRSLRSGGSLDSATR